MDLRNLHAVFGLSGKITGTRAGTVWKPLIGIAPTRVEWEGITPVLYSVTLSGIDSLVNPILDLSDGTVTADGATVDGAGVDFQGDDLPAMSGVLAFLMERLDADTQGVAVEDMGSAATIWHLGPGNKILHLTTATESPQIADTVSTLTFGAMGSPSSTIQVRVTVLALAAA